MTHGIGVIGCGNISAAYMRHAPMFRDIEIRACADMNPETASARAGEFGIRAVSVDDLFELEDVDTILNLTVPAAHFEVSKRALSAGKHVYSEKPFVLSLDEGRTLAELAASADLRVGSAPDTFLGGAHQLARHLVDAGAVGPITSGTCFFQSPGMEGWHPNPNFFFKAGGGPVLDVGPYYISNLVQLLGPVARVVALGTMASAERTITSQPRYGQKIKVETPTTIHALLAFRSGAQITFCASWDVWQHSHTNMELYGRDGTLHVPDPDRFGGEVRLTRRQGFVNATPDWPHPFSRNNDPRGFANYRAAGLADMMRAVDEGRPHRCSLEFSLHVVEVLTSILKSGEIGKWVEIETVCDRPAPLPPEESRVFLT